MLVGPSDAFGITAVWAHGVRRRYNQRTRMPSAHLIGVPLDLGGNRRGVDMGPSAIRISGLAEQLAGIGVAVTDKGDIPSPLPEVKGPGDPRKRYIRDITRVCQKLYQTALASLHEGALPIVLGGDHSL